MQLTKRQKKAIAVAEKKEQDLNRIKEASKSLLSFDATNTALFTSPDIKPCIRVKDNDFTIGSYVEVIEDTKSTYPI